MSFLDDWVNRPKNPEDLSRFTIDYNRWDRREFIRMLQEIREFQIKRQQLIDEIAGDVGYDVWQDAWNALWKVNPEMLPNGDVRPSHVVNYMVMTELQQLAEYIELHDWTNGDNVSAALACIAMEPEIAMLYDRLHEAQKLADEMDELLHQLAKATQEQQSIEELWEEWTQDHDPEAPENVEANQEHEAAAGEAQEQVDGLKQQMSGLGEELESALNGARPDVRHSLREMLQGAVDEAKALSTAGQMAGVDPGVLHRLPASERIELAKKLSKGKIKEIAALFGKLKPWAFRMQREKVDYLREETFDVEIGADLETVMSHRLAQLQDPDEEDLFYLDFSEKKLEQFKMRGTEPLHKGGIIQCHDGSGSMSGAREKWCKAIGLCLLHVAKKEKRPFYGIQFGSAHQIRVDDFRDTRKITPEAVIDYAEFFFGGGTDFETPLNKAIEILEEENRRTGAIKSDIVFVTDGQCSVGDSWFEELQKTKKRLDIRIWGVIIDGDPRMQPLNKICDGKVFTLKNLTSGEDVSKIFRSI